MQTNFGPTLSPTLSHKAETILSANDVCFQTLPSPLALLLIRQTETISTNDLCFETTLKLDFGVVCVGSKNFIVDVDHHVVDRVSAEDSVAD